MTTHHIQYGSTTIEYQLAYAARKTLAISVHPDLTVTVIAPQDVPLEAVQARVQKRANWILRQQREFALYLPHIPPRQYISGETHWYLGKQYRLKVMQAADMEWVSLERGRICVRTTDKTDAVRVEALVKGWYLRRARWVFQERLRALLPRFAALNLPEFELRIKPLTARWGSCTAAGIITLNLQLIQVSKSSIDYVLVHELCHLMEHNHSKRFYQLLDRMLPDWRVQRKALNEQLR